MAKKTEKVALNAEQKAALASLTQVLKNKTVPDKLATRIANATAALQKHYEKDATAAERKAAKQDKLQVRKEKLEAQLAKVDKALE